MQLRRHPTKVQVSGKLGHWVVQPVYTATQAAGVVYSRSHLTKERHPNCLIFGSSETLCLAG